MIKIIRSGLGLEREPLKAPFGFKGRSLSELWQVAARLESDSGGIGIGVGTQSVLWSDAAVFTQQDEEGGNRLMFQLTDYALRRCEGCQYTRPDELIDQILPDVMSRGRVLTGRESLRPTFALNALVAVDNAAWQLYAGARSESSFAKLTEDILPGPLAGQPRLGNIPLISYGTAPEDAAALARGGCFVLKIKLGHDPAGDGDQEKMLKWDCGRLSALHAVLRECPSEFTASGRVAYYLDANGRYESVERLRRLLDHCDAIGAMDQIVLLEEPFPEALEVDVRDLPVCIAGDESVHAPEDANARIDAGYRALALKPVAKTLSMTLRIAAAARARQVPCFCADLTANPVLVDWGKNLAARLDPLPGLKAGVLESNGSQNYRDWSRLLSYHPLPDGSWIQPRAGHFDLDSSFFASAGGIFLRSPHYEALAPVGS